MHYYQFNIKSYQAATSHLTNEEDLAYRRLLDYYYDTEQRISNSIPDKPSALQWLTRRLRVDQKALETILSEFFTETESGWIHEYCESIIAEYHSFKERQRINGSKGGRGNKANAKPEKPSGLPEKPSGKPTINNKPLTNTYTDDFENAWSLYPQRPGANKKKSFAAWQARIKSGVSADQIIEGIKRYSNYCKTNGTEPTFIKQPQTFFGPDEHYLLSWGVVAKQTYSSVDEEVCGICGRKANSRMSYGWRCTEHLGKEKGNMNERANENNIRH